MDLGVTVLPGVVAALKETDVELKAWKVVIDQVEGGVKGLVSALGGVPTALGNAAKAITGFVGSIMPGNAGGGGPHPGASWPSGPATNVRPGMIPPTPGTSRSLSTTTPTSTARRSR
jgi:hypothetical protein